MPQGEPVAEQAGAAQQPQQQVEAGTKPQAVAHPTLPASLGQARQEGYANVSPTKAQELIQGQSYSYVDVRTPEEYSEGHAPGSVNIPLLVKGDEGQLVPNPTFLPEVQQRFQDSDAPIVTSCMHGRRGELAAQTLADAGFANLRNIAGGFAAWALADLPTTKEDEKK